MREMRRRILATLGSLVATGLAGCGGDTTPATSTSPSPTSTLATTPSPPASPTATDIEPTATSTATAAPTSTTPAAMPDRVALEPLATGMEVPLDVAFAPDADRRYIADQPGIIHVHEADGFQSSSLLDIGDSIEYGGEKGLLGIALHPDFTNTRRLFVRYSSPKRADTPTDYSHTFVLSEFLVTEDGRAIVADSERAVLEIPEPQANHNAGSIAFGPDGYLYVGVGDGGAGGDQGDGHVGDWYDAVDGGNGQDVEANLLGSILRIDVDTGARGEYGIPEDNPLVDSSGLDEHYAWGLRNPWRFSFDGDRFFVGDVGQNSYEEVDLVERGGNYGWNVREGTHCYGADSCPTATPDDVRGGESLQDPIIEYPHSDAPVSGSSVIGGTVARDDALPGLDGIYVFGDLSAAGRLFVATPTEDGGLWETAQLPIVEADLSKLLRLFAFGRDPQGRVYLLSRGEGGGGLHRVAPAG